MSFDLDLAEKDEASSDFVAVVGDKLQQALLHRKTHDKLTQRALADKLEVDRSRVNRCFSGHSNMTIATLAEIAWALGNTIVFDLVPEEEFGADMSGSNYHSPAVPADEIEQPHHFASNKTGTRSSQSNSFSGAVNWK